MVQEIITLTIVFMAAAYAVFSIIKSLATKSSGGCGDSCSCSAKDDIRKMLKNADFKEKKFSIDFQNNKLN